MRTAKSRVVRRVGGICGLAVAAALTVTACSEESGESADTTSEATESQQAEESEESTEVDESAADASGEAQGGGQAAAGDAVAVWITAIVEDRPVDACLAMGTPGADGALAANTAEMCEGEGPQAEQARQSVSALRESFAPENPGQPLAVEVAEGTESAGTVTFDGEQVTVDGQTLQDIVVSNSTGVEPGQIGIGIDASEIEGLWYVTDMSLSFG
ncbi:hypothetical protein [Streptomyces millisiae]|uniref:Lipoprotein n=1 Tax=Streptomyces millisiae TaxID=3075542 RepID=A0ABU2LR73_9ACTN|nr:hypothetical protein [Streptomyces sp. DSM 44918]MDT0320087.1 hypothetical protein [Streptomyces sp. DSM 44918]